MTKRLVIAPHVDDDVLGCGGILDAETVTFYCGVDAIHRASRVDRYVEALRVYERTGGRFLWPTYHDQGPVEVHEPHREWHSDLPVNEFQSRMPFLIDVFERLVEREEPLEVYVPWPSYNQDHRAVYEAALVALRPHDENHRVERVLVYEGSQINFWDWSSPAAQFHPNYFVPIDIEEKLARYACMPSQVRGMRSPEMLRALATLRGGEIGVPAAEAFQILRWVGER